jgi:hypothetical protein
MKKLLLLALASLWCGNVAAALNPISSTVCNGCSDWAMLDAAARKASKGTVYVFNATNNKARKYSVQTEIISLKPYWAETWADEVAIETDVKSAFNKLVTTQNGILQGGTIVLPPTFPIRSVAGAMLEPGSTATRVSDYLGTQPGYKELELSVSALLLSWVKRNIPFVNLSDVVKITKIVVEFADGSTMEYEIYFSVNAVTGAANMEVKPAGNARLDNGTPAPTGALGFNGFSANNAGGALHEWLMWAAFNGVKTVGTGTYVTCSITSGAIICVLRSY